MSKIGIPYDDGLTQYINPWTLRVSPTADRLGFINIKQMASSDGEVEQAIVADVASYGRQLRRITNVLTLPLKRQEKAKPFEKKQLRDVERFRTMAKDIGDKKARFAQTPRKRIDRFVDDLHGLRQRQPEFYGIVVDRLCGESGLRRTTVAT